jgi:hypothetical protein
MSFFKPTPDCECDELDFTRRLRFPAVIKNEYDEIDARRRAADRPSSPRVKDRPPNITGLALSGGGVRSATFNLGLLQALAAAEKLTSFDYLSTVSGGGYCGGWWSAWLARQARDREGTGVFPPPEDIENKRDDRREKMAVDASRSNFDRPQINDSAVNAGKDPIHHLRLFSNVMTPRKGLLSADTWRAIAVISRNLVLTWMILLPMMLAAIIIGQAWFTLVEHDQQSWTETLLGALYVPGLLFIGSIVCATFWMLFSRRWTTLGDKLVSTLSTIAFLVLTKYIISVFLNIQIPTTVYVVLGGWVVYVILRLTFWKFTHNAGWRDADFWRNRLLFMQTKTLSYSVFTLVIFLFAGFGYRVFDFLLKTGSNALSQQVAKAGGWSAFAVAAFSAAYTAFKKAPTGGGDSTKPSKPPLTERIIVAIAPPLLLLVLGVVLSWVGNHLYRLVYEAALCCNARPLVLLGRGALISAFLFLIFALYEFRPPQRWKSLVVVVFWIGTVAVAFIVGDHFNSHPVLWGAATLGLLAAVLVFRSFLRKELWISYYAAALAATSAWLFVIRPPASPPYDPYLTQGVVAGVVATLVLLVFELIQGRGANTRSIALAVIACTLFVLIGVAGWAGLPYGLRALTIVSLVATVLGWVLALGWLADPNSLTIHAFYKARLVRAYMGASNERRAGQKDVEITDAAPGDDVLLTQLRNTDRGAPYHLINTMLNLVGGGDLSTQARSSDLFLMSKLYCGSSRTGYRPTKEYACGSISLGTAVAVSGAAASPTMGAQTPSAALSALMTLFNIRTGYWAPTPSLSYWRSGAARLWPVYTMQELVSQTMDLLPYCYLTDGGHYENTGVYSLIQRGCRLIVVGECGADPQATLDDLGNMIRKVRIDFRTEVTFGAGEIEKFRTLPPAPREHVVTGKIRYGKEHADALGLTEEERDGTIIVVKPNVAPDVALDVRQYGFLNADFPQQQTFDLWYDEAQFESYRRLGQSSGEIAVTTMNQVMQAAGITP